MNTTDLHIPSNKVRDIERYILTELSGMYPDGELRMFARLLFEAYFGWSYAELLSCREETINQSDLLRFHWAVEDLKRHRPIQHIIGYTDFCGCRIEVDESTLIPRPETEEIVNNTLSLLSRDHCQQPTVRVLDLCTGSGCIAIALARHIPNSEVWAVDVSEKALAVAKRNAAANNVSVHYCQCDLLANSFEGLDGQYTVIISNPPYIMEKERETMQPNVLDWEPGTALFVPDTDPLCFYRSIADIALHSLDYNGFLVLEINEQLYVETAALMESKGFQVTLHNDFRGKPRMLVAVAPTVR